MILPGDSGVADGGGGVTLARTAPSAVWLAPTANWATMTTTTTATQAATAAPVPEDRVVGVRSGAGRAGIEARPATQPPTRARAGSFLEVDGGGHGEGHHPGGGARGEEIAPSDGHDHPGAGRHQQEHTGHSAIGQDGEVKTSGTNPG